MKKTKRKYKLITPEITKKIEECAQSGLTDVEIGLIFDIDKTCIYNITTPYWERKMEVHLINAKKEHKFKAETKQMIIVTGENTGFAVAKCCRCSVIRDIEVKECKHCN